MCKDSCIFGLEENLEDSGGWSAKRSADVNMQGLVHLRIGVMKAKLIIDHGNDCSSHVF